MKEAAHPDGLIFIDSLPAPKGYFNLMMQACFLAFATE